MKIVLAPQEFKGSLTAREAAAALALGVRRVLPEAELDEIPLADGGPGMVDALVAARMGELRTATVRDPLGRPVEAAFGLIDDGRTAILEMAAASGLSLLRANELDALRAGTHGTGELIRAALDAGARALIIGIGGSAATDAGAGMAQALGVRLLDRLGRDLPSGGAALADLDTIEMRQLDPRLRAVRIIAACDVRNPLCGPQGAAAIYGPQKGATPDMVETLDGALRRFAEVVKRDLGADVIEIPGAGAAGGLGAGLVAFLGAELRPGFPLIAAAARLEERLRGADLILTGEGQIDGQTPFGKTVAGVADLASRHGIPVIALAGGLGAGYERVLDAGVTAAFSIVPGPMLLDQAESHAAEYLAACAEAVVRTATIARR